MAIFEQTLIVTLQYDPSEAGPPDGWDWAELLDHPSDMICVTPATPPSIAPTEPGEDDDEEVDLVEAITAGAIALAEQPALTVADVVKKLTENES